MGMITGDNLIVKRPVGECDEDKEVALVYKDMDSELVFIKCLFNVR